MYASSSRGKKKKYNDVEVSRNYLLAAFKNLKAIDEERLKFIERLQSGRSGIEKRFLESTIERLTERRKQAEGQYLTVLKGFPAAGPLNMYEPNSEFQMVRNFPLGGPPPFPDDDTLKNALLYPSTSDGPNARFLNRKHDPLTLQNFLRSHHDNARVRLEILENAYKQKSKTHSYDAHVLYDNWITLQKKRLKAAWLDQERSLTGTKLTGIVFPQDRRRTEEEMRRWFADEGLDYDSEHDLPSTSTANTGNQNRNRAPRHAAGLRHHEATLFPEEHGHYSFISDNEALAYDLDDIDVLTHELDVARANKEKMKNERAKQLYEESIERLEDRIEVIRRHRDRIARREQNVDHRPRYIPGSETVSLKNAFECNHLNWNQEHEI